MVGWTDFVLICLDLHPREFLDPIQELFRRDLIDPILGLDYEDIAEEATEDPEAHHQQRLAVESNTPITDTDMAVSWWDNFTPPRDPAWQGIDADFPLYDLAATPVVREQPKIGRNDLCPCGSGKKYKSAAAAPRRRAQETRGACAAYQLSFRARISPISWT